MMRHAQVFATAGPLRRAGPRLDVDHRARSLRLHRAPGSSSPFVAALLLALAAIVPRVACAQLPVHATTNQVALLASPDPKLTANKKLVYDFWREVLEGGHLELVDRYLAESYMQHNPNVATGRAAFVAYFGRILRPQAIQPRIKAPLVTITAEGDIVVFSFVREQPDLQHAGQKTTTTAFDMFRIEGGRIAEHWDATPKKVTFP